MENSIKDYIIFNVFSDYLNSVLCVKDDDIYGFSVALPSIIPSVVFSNIYLIFSYLKDHNISWYVACDHFDGHSIYLSCISFYIDKE